MVIQAWLRPPIQISARFPYKDVLSMSAYSAMIKTGSIAFFDRVC
jgi:hypothetical protein